MNKYYVTLAVEVEAESEEDAATIFLEDMVMFYENRTPIPVTVQKELDVPVLIEWQRKP